MHYSPTAHSIWEDLRERFSKIERTHVFHLHQEIYHIKQGTLSIEHYFGKLKVSWDELVAIDDDSMCNVCSSRVVAKKDKDRLIQFLVGLNGTFNFVRSNLLMMNPLPTLNYACSILIQEDNQRQISIIVSNSHEIDVVVLYSSNNYVNVVAPHNKKGWICTFCGLPDEEV